MTAWADHGPEGAGEPLAIVLRPGNAGSNTAADHITVARQALAQLPSHRPGHRRGRRPGRRVLIRTDGAGASHDFLNWLHRRRSSYSISFGLPDDTAELLATIPAEGVDPPACDANDGIRDRPRRRRPPPGPHHRTSRGPRLTQGPHRPDDPHHPRPWNRRQPERHRENRRTRHHNPDPTARKPPSR
jgi:hypothetical protein